MQCNEEDEEEEEEGQVGTLASVQAFELKRLIESPVYTPSSRWMLQCAC